MMITDNFAIQSNDQRLPNIVGKSAKIELLISSKPVTQNCLLEATNDLTAVQAWLQQHSHKLTTYRGYKREAERLLLWCIYECGKTLAQLKVEDLTNYFKFLQNPPLNWCTTRSDLRIGKKGDSNWRPFIGALNQSALKTAHRIINSLLNYLVDANYLAANPLRLIKKHTNFLSIEEQKYQIWSKMLAEDEWHAVQVALQNMPEENELQIDNKMRTQFLFALFYFLGLRINEVATSSWNAFREHQGNWWFFVRGKGDKLGHIPVNDQLLSFVKTYRLYLGKPMLPQTGEGENLLISKKTKRALSNKQLYSLVKDIGRIAAKQFVDSPRKQQKLYQLSPHSLRHLSASHQNKAGIPATMIRDNHRHSSLQTTQIYVHTEDDLRFKEMQKIKLEYVPKLIGEINPTKNIELTIILKSNSICEEYSFIRLMEVIETIILQDLKWQKNQDNKTLLEIFRQSQIYKQAITLQYMINGINKENEVNQLKQIILREAEIRLFGCEIKINNIMPR